LNFYWTLNRSGGILPLSSVDQIIKFNLSEDEIGRGGGGGSSVTHNFSQPRISPRLEFKYPDSYSPLVHIPKNFGKESMEIRSKSGARENVVEGDRIFHQSLLSYQVNSESDFGLIGCWARNSYGKQVFPCLFRIVPGKFPFHYFLFYFISTKFKLIKQEHFRKLCSQKKPLSIVCLKQYFPGVETTWD